MKGDLLLQIMVQARVDNKNSVLVTGKFGYPKKPALRASEITVKALVIISRPWPLGMR